MQFVILAIAKHSLAVWSVKAAKRSHLCSIIIIII